MDLSGKVVWLTGASSGIGAETAKELDKRGAIVHGTARREERLKEIEGQLRNFRPAPGDVSDLEAMKAIAEKIRDEHGHIDIALFNAGTWHQLKIREFSSEPIRKGIEVNFMGMVHGIEATLPAMLERGEGTIAGVASVAGYRGLPSAEAYSPAKAAMINLLECLRIDAGGKGIKVVTINPGFVDTEMTERNRFPMPFMVSAESAGEAIVDGLEADRNEIVFPLPMKLMMKAVNLLPIGVHAAALRKGAR